MICFKHAGQAAMVAHRGNLNYQNCRRTLTLGFEADDMEDLREVGEAEPVAQSLASGSSSVAQSVAVPFEIKSKTEAVRFRVKIASAGILASEFWKVLGLQ